MGGQVSGERFSFRTDAAYAYVVEWSDGDGWRDVCQVSGIARIPKAERIARAMNASEPRHG